MVTEPLTIDQPTTVASAMLNNEETVDAIDLTEVAGSDPAALLLVDLATRTIVFANGVAEHLAPGVRLPADLDTWSDTAVLRDLDGGELSESIHPLSALAESRPVLGQGISAARDTELGRTRAPLWVVAIPLSGAPQLEGHALVVFLPLANRATAQNAASAAQTQAELRDRAILATGMSFTMADAQAPDMPLMWVNPAFTTATGYSFEEAVGSNCRFLQGKGTDSNAHVLMREALDAGESILLTVLNYRKDGTAFWNQISMSPIHDAEGTLTHYVGIQTDVTGRVQADQERDRALAAEKAARQDAEQAQRRLALLAEATSQLATTLDVNESLTRLSALVVPLLADCVIIANIDRNAVAPHVIARHHNSSQQHIADKYAAYMQTGFTAGSLLQNILNGEPATFINDYNSPENRQRRAEWVMSPDVLTVSDELGVQSAMFVPLPGRDHLDGLMVLLRGPDSEPYTEQDLAVADDLGRRAGLILDNARLYQSEHHIAEALQRSLLPELPSIPGINAAARYWASESGAAVGGDFYELIPLPNDCIGFLIGDVVGHDVYAAAAMGHLRGLLRACAWDGPEADKISPNSQNPARVLDRVDQLMRGLDIPTIASVAYACLEPQADGTWLMHYSSAGHPPMMIRHTDDTVETLDGVGGLLLGIQNDARTSASRFLGAGTTVIAYTDGLVERREQSLTVGLERLAHEIKGGPQEPAALCDHLLSAFDEEVSDDVALLALRLETRTD